MADEPTVDTGNGEQQEVDYSNETLEQIEARFAAGEGMIITEDDTIAPAPEPEAAPTPEPEPEAEPEVAAEAEAPEAVVEEPDGEQEEPEFDEHQSRVEELKLELEKSELGRKKFEHLQSRDAGLAGHLKQEIQSLKKMLSQPAPAAEQDPYAEAPVVQQAPVQPGDSATQSRLAELEASARAEALQLEYEAFRVARGVAPEDSEILQKMAPAIRGGWSAYEDQVADMSPLQVRKAIRLVLDGAYVDMGLTEIREARSQAEARKVSQVPEKRKAKLAASVSGSGSTPAPALRPKKDSELSGDEADAALIKEFGDGHYIRTDR